MTTFTVRRLDHADAEAWASLRREALEVHPLVFGASVPDDPKGLIDFILLRLDAAESAVLGAFSNDVLVGIIGIHRHGGKKERHKAHIWGMYVTAPSRRSGAGKMLLDTAIQQARSWSGVEQIHLAVSDVATEAKRLYQRFGFREWGREPRALCWQGRYADETHMVLYLGDSQRLA